jgi:hypothetical protein
MPIPAESDLTEFGNLKTDHLENNQTQSSESEYDA